MTDLRQWNEDQHHIGAHDVHEQRGVERKRIPGRVHDKEPAYERNRDHQRQGVVLKPTQPSSGPRHRSLDDQRHRTDDRHDRQHVCNDIRQRRPGPTRPALPQRDVTGKKNRYQQNRNVEDQTRHTNEKTVAHLADRHQPLQRAQCQLTVRHVLVARPVNDAPNLPKREYQMATQPQDHEGQSRPEHRSTRPFDPSFHGLPRVLLRLHARPELLFRNHLTSDCQCRTPRPPRLYPLRLAALRLRLAPYQSRSPSAAGRAGQSLPRHRGRCLRRLP